MNPAAPSAQALALEHRAAPLGEISSQIFDLELQLEHLHAARADAELATRQLAALKTFLDDLLTEPPLAWAEPTSTEALPVEPVQAADVPEDMPQAAPKKAPAEHPVLENTPEPEAEPPAAEIAPLEDTPEQPDNALDTPPAALPPEPEMTPQTPAKPEDQDEPDEDPEPEGNIAKVEREIVAWLSAHPGFHTGRELSAALDAYPNISNILTPLFREGKIQRTGEGGRNDPYQYFVPTPTAEPETPGITPEPAQPEAALDPLEELRTVVSQEGILAWFQTHPGQQSTAAVADAFDISSNSAGITMRLKKLWELGALRRFGQGIPGDPFRYCLPDAVTRPPVSVPVVPESPKLSVPPVQPAAPVQLDPVVKAIHRSQVLKELGRVGTLTAKTCAAALDLDQLVAERCLEALCDSGETQRISLIRTESGARSLGYRLPKTNREGTADLAVPAQLTQDESALFTELRKDFKGKVVRTLLVRTQWNLPRLRKALDGLLHAGHIGQWGSGTSATYAALTPQVWR